MTTTPTSRAVLRPARMASLVTGFGLGMFLDGIVLHQLLKWHHLVSAYAAPGDLRALQTNTFWDGVFHLGAWVVVVVGVAMLVRAGSGVRALGSRGVTGLALVGWGAFHGFDQVVFHLLLQAHHIRMVENYQLYDWGYTAIGVVLIVAGRRLARSPAG